jgi:uroporphyrinogen-III synthase
MGSRPPTNEQKARLRDIAIQSVHYPVIETRPVSFTLPKGIDWLIVTSPNAVQWVADALPELAETRIAVVERKTADALAKYGLTANFCPSTFRGDALVAELGPYLSDGDHIVFARGNRPRQAPVDQLRKLSRYTIEDILTYETVTRRLPEALIRNATYIGLQSPSAVEAIAPLDLKTTFFVIGTITEQTAKAAGLQPIHVAREFTADGMIDRIIEEESE